MKPIPLLSIWILSYLLPGILALMVPHDFLAKEAMLKVWSSCIGDSLAIEFEQQVKDAVNECKFKTQDDTNNNGETDNNRINEREQSSFRVRDREENNLNVEDRQKEEENSRFNGNRNRLNDNRRNRFGAGTVSDDRFQDGDVNRNWDNHFDNFSRPTPSFLGINEDTNERDITNDRTTSRDRTRNFDRSSGRDRNSNRDATPTDDEEVRSSNQDRNRFNDRDRTNNRDRNNKDRENSSSTRDRNGTRNRNENRDRNGTRNRDNPVIRNDSDEDDDKSGGNYFNQRRIPNLKQNAPKFNFKRNYGGLPSSLSTDLGDEVKPVYFTLIDQIPFLLQNERASGIIRSKRQTSSVSRFSVKELIDGENELQSHLSNFSCVLKTLNLVNSAGDLQVKTILTNVGNLPIDSNLKNDLQNVIKDCAALTSCQPTDDDDTLISHHLESALSFFKCSEQRRQMACIKKDIRNQLKEEIPQERQRSFNMERTVKRIMYIKMKDTFADFMTALS